eukprot:7575314-Pyramimonas_sp.AAC.1
MQQPSCFLALKSCDWCFGTLQDLQMDVSQRGTALSGSEPLYGAYEEGAWRERVTSNIDAESW